LKSSEPLRNSSGKSLQPNNKGWEAKTEASRRLMEDAIRAHKELQKVNKDLRRIFQGRADAGPAD